MLRCVILLLSCCTSLNLLAESRQSVYWLYSEMPPAHISHGEHVNTGYADLAMQLLIDALPQYDHVRVLANYKRSLIEIKANDNVCHAALLRSEEREEFVAFSMPAYIVSSNKLFAQPSHKSLMTNYLSQNGKVDLARLLANETFVLGVSSGAMYGSGIDEALNLPSSQDNLIYRTAIDHYSGLSGMLEKSMRLDGFLGLAVENRFFQKPNSAINSNSVSYSIEGTDDFLVGYIGCSKSAFGMQLIDEINHVLAVERAGKIKDYYQSWLLEEDRAAHQMLVEQLFDKN